MMSYAGFDEFSHIERLEDGVYLERLLPDFKVADEDEQQELVYGKIPDCLYSGNEMDWGGNALLYTVVNQLTPDGITEQDIPEKSEQMPEVGYSLVDVRRIYESCGLCTEELENVSLSDLLELVDSESQVLCYVNTWMLDAEQRVPLDWAMPNNLVAVHVIDLTDPVVIAVRYSSTDADSGVQRCSWTVFQKAWACSGRTALVVAKGEEL